jgi:amino acid transporter
MRISRRIASLAISIGVSGGLFYYLSETLIQWRIVFSALMFLAAYVMLDGFLRRA